MDDAYLIVGLGNPGKEYERTRHNAGFMAIERLTQKWGGAWKAERKFHARVARVEVDGRKVFLCEPETYMNLSGEAVAAIAEFYRIPVSRILVLVDDADLPLGQIRLRASGSNGGHHGLESIELHLGTRDFARLRIGIGRTEQSLREITGHVLGRFSQAEFALVEKVLDRTSSQAECWMTEGVQKAMNKFNGAVEAPAKKESM